MADYTQKALEKGASSVAYAYKTASYVYEGYERPRLEVTKELKGLIGEIKRT